ncbi:hypothetical protein QTG54_014506 [Skeletonema marinoi]|uniref:Glutaredoxin domain-containing protein n=1 Tax=Skeletonema marinoi TaxID=267567 RepID=A0AAD8XVV7_9STRA|nr:hypothetical protein QTG54_014506 [Skeletonema marinoi]
MNQLVHKHKEERKQALLCSSLRPRARIFVLLALVVLVNFLAALPTYPHFAPHYVKTSNMTNSSAPILFIAMVACFLMGASAFQIGSSSSRPHINTISSSQLPRAPSSSSLYSTPMKDLPAAVDTENDGSTTDFIFSEISSNDRMGIPAKIINLDKISNGLGPAKDSVAVKLLELTGQRTVPNVFVLGKHLGGNDEAQDAARSGALKQMLSNTNGLAL